MCPEGKWYKVSLQSHRPPCSLSSGVSAAAGSRPAGSEDTRAALAAWPTAGARAARGLLRESGFWTEDLIQWPSAFQAYVKPTWIVWK